MEIKVCDESRPGLEILEYHGGPGYDEERMILENSLGSGLRFLVQDDDDDHPFLAHFHIKNPETARAIAARLLEWCERIAAPPYPAR